MFLQTLKRPINVACFRREFLSKLAQRLYSALSGVNSYLRRCVSRDHTVLLCIHKWNEQRKFPPLQKKSQNKEYWPEFLWQITTVGNSLPSFVKAIKMQQNAPFLAIFKKKISGWDIGLVSPRIAIIHQQYSGAWIMQRWRRTMETIKTGKRSAHTWHAHRNIAGNVCIWRFRY